MKPCIAVIILLASGASAENSMDELTDRVLDQLIDRVFKVGNNVDVDSTTLGKAGTLVVPAPSSSLGTATASRGAQMMFRAQPPRVPQVGNMCNCPVEPRIAKAKDIMMNAKELASNSLQSLGTTGVKSAAALALSAMLITQPADASSASAAKDLADGLYPIVEKITKDQLKPITGEVIETAISADPKLIIKTIDSGLEAFLSAPPDKFFAFAKALEEGTTEASAAGSCKLICLPSKETAEKVSAIAVDALGAANQGKVKAFLSDATATFNSADSAKLTKTTADLTKFSTSVASAQDLEPVTTALKEILGS